MKNIKFIVILFTICIFMYIAIRKLTRRYAILQSREGYTEPIPSMHVQKTAQLSPEAKQKYHDDMQKIIVTYEKDRELLLKALKMMKPSLVDAFNKDKESVRQQYAEIIPNDLKIRILKLAVVDKDMKELLVNDEYFKRYLSYYIIPKHHHPLSLPDITANNLALKEYFIKGSFDSTFNGSAPSIDELKQQILNGYRFIDLNVFAIHSDKTNGYSLYVGQSNDKVTPSIDATLPLSTVLTYINEYAFNKDANTIPGENDKFPSLFTNYADYPLFILFRINRQKDSNMDMVQLIYDNYLKMDKEGKGGLLSDTKLLRNKNEALPITGEVALSNVKGKIILCMDIDNILNTYTTSLDAKDVPQSVKQCLRKFVNVKTGGDTWMTTYGDDSVKKLKRNELTVPSDIENITNVMNWNIAFPSKDTDNLDALDNARYYQTQLTLMKRYKKDANLNKYESVFTYFKAPMVPMSQIIRYNNLLEKGEL